MIDIKKSSYALDKLYVLDTASKWIAKSKDEEHIKQPYLLNHLSIQKERMLFLLKFYPIRVRLRS